MVFVTVLLVVSRSPLCLPVDSLSVSVLSPCLPSCLPFCPPFCLPFGFDLATPADENTCLHKQPTEIDICKRLQRKTQFYISPLIPVYVPCDTLRLRFSACYYANNDRISHVCQILFNFFSDPCRSVH